MDDQTVVLIVGKTVIVKQAQKAVLIGNLYRSFRWVKVRVRLTIVKVTRALLLVRVGLQERTAGQQVYKLFLVATT